MCIMTRIEAIIAESYTPAAGKVCAEVLLGHTAAAGPLGPAEGAHAH